MCRGRRARILLHLHIQREKIVLRGIRAGRRSDCRNHPPACMCEGGGRGGDRGGRAFYYTYIYNGKRESCETAFLAMPQNTIY